MSDDLSGFSMMELFRAETESQVAILSSGLLTLEAAGATPDAIEPLMRAAHSLKGAARIVGVDTAVRVAHAMEDAFVAAQNGAIRLLPEHIDRLLRAVDLLTRISEVSEDQVESWTSANESTIDELVAELKLIRQDGGDNPASAPPERAVEQPPLEAEANDTAGPTVSQTVATKSVESGESSTSEAPEPSPAAGLPPAEPAAKASAKAEPVDRVVRVTADSLSRLVALAGESLVQSRQLRPFVDSLQRLRNRQNSLLASLQAVEQHLSDVPTNSHSLLSEHMGSARARASECSQVLRETVTEIEDLARRSEELSGRLHQEVLASRMRPLADGIRGFPRMVRDVARQLGRRVEWEVRGETTGVDRDILEKLEAPLNHLVRNALDHAIEPPEERIAAGKAPAGTIRLEAHHRAGMLQITLSDDGRGIDQARLRSRIVERGLASPAMAEQLSEAELLEFLFLPGFSTKDKVTEISGRGVGLDVVQSMVRAVGGIVRISTQPGRGTRFTLQLPITRSVIRALLVKISGEPYAFPLNRIDRILMLEKEQLQVLEGRRHFVWDDHPIGLVDAAQVLELPAPPPHGQTYPVVVVSDRSHRFGMVVDQFLGERDLEVRPLDPRLGKVPDVSSASVLDDGFAVLIFDVEDLVRSIDNLLGGRRLAAPADGETADRARGPKRVLVVDDSLTVRELERQMLESRGYTVDVAFDGVEGWNAVRSTHYQLVISDVDMPRMDGIQLVRSIKSDERLRSTPVVIVSYKDREEDRIRGLDAGADAYLTKSSFHDQTLIDTVIDLIGEARE